jgi:hypothetical protein
MLCVLRAGGLKILLVIGGGGALNQEGGLTVAKAALVSSDAAPRTCSEDSKGM